MGVRETSAIAHVANDHTTLKHRVRVWVRLNQPCSRRMIASGLAVDTASISGVVTPLVREGFLDETGKGKCKITGNKAIMLESPVEQLALRM